MRRNEDRYNGDVRFDGKFADAAKYVYYELSLAGWADLYTGSVKHLGFYALFIFDSEIFEEVKELTGNLGVTPLIEEPVAAILGEQSTGAVTVVFYSTKEAAEDEWQKIEDDYDRYFDYTHSLGTGEGSW